MDVTLSGSEIRDSFTRSFASLAESNKYRFERCRLEDQDFATQTPGGEAIHIERAFRARVERCNIQGPYARGVSMHFCLYGEIDNVSVQGASVGFFVGDGRAVWTDATQSNSASNQATLHKARFHGSSDSDIGFVIEGASGVDFVKCTVEGHACGCGFKIFPMATRSTTTLYKPWIEVPVKTAIEFDSQNSRLVIESMNFAKQPEILLNCRGDQDSTIVFARNNWREIPPILLSATTKVELYGNSFSDEQFWKAARRPGE